MKILWFTWKDIKNPLSGGAEVVNEELAKRLVKDGHEVVFIVAGYAGCTEKEKRDGFEIIRLGGRWSVYIKAYFYYKKHLENWPDLVVDEVNTIPFFAKFYVKQKNILFVHQLAREIWFYQMIFPISLLGFFLEPAYLWLLCDRKVITISESTKTDLKKFGFKEKNINIISNGIEFEPIERILDEVKYPKKTLLSLGSVRPMKRTIDAFRAFEIAKNDIKDLELIIAGDVESSYGKKLINLVNKSKYRSSIKILGKVNRAMKIDLMQKSHLLLVTSVKEGWGLVVTEANSQGTPAVVYNVDGLRDSVINGQTGLVCEKNTPMSLAKKVQEILTDKKKYDLLSNNALENSRKINFNTGYNQLLKAINE